jgi:DNA-binding CsgD family transcriptional regulator
LAYDGHVLYGRDAERAKIGALLEAARASRSGALVLRGQPGIGKTALLEDARERAVDMHVLSAQGVESESELPFAGLHQLIRPALHLLERLPGPQADALQGALGLAEGPGDERFLVSAACLTLLSELAERRPVLCLVDDAQWLDVPSADALLFVARRLDAEGIVMLFTAREPDIRRFEARELPNLELGGLDPKSAASLIARAATDDLPPSVLDHLVEQSGGNALALVELPATLTAAQIAGNEPLPETLPLTRDLERLFLQRVRRLPEPTQRMLLLAAADDTGRVAPVIRAAEALGIHADALSAAEQAGLISVHGPNFELRHPLIRSTVYHGSSSSERREAHLAFANTLNDVLESDQRAWHRAAAAVGPDADIADELESTADRARLRSGHAAAATALERAAELSAESGSQARRLVAAADAAWHAGHADRATALIDRASTMFSDPRLEAELAHLRGVIQFWCGGLLEACEILLAAVDAAPLDHRKKLEMLFDAAEAAAWAGDFARVAEVGQRASALPPSDAREDTFLANLLIGVGGLFEGKTTRDVPAILDVLARADDFEQPRWLVWAASAAGVVGDEARETALLRRAVALARASGAVDSLTHVLVTVAARGLFEGRQGATVDATEGLTLAREAGLPNGASLHLAILAWFAGVKGEDAECRAHAAEVNQAARTAGHGFANSIAEWGVALLDLSRGRPDEAATRLAAVSEARPGVGQPFIALASAADLVEAYVRAGRDEEAQTAYSALDRFARPGAPPWALALAARCRGLLAQDDEAEGEFADALQLHSESNRLFDRARTELLFGEHLRRARRRRESREHLRGALEAFEALGASPWADRARSELRASGETARKRDPSTIDQLTPQELQIARFVAEGLSNKEVAAQLFLSPRTIDYHLRNVFAKLGITSRIQLARFPLREEDEVTGASREAQPRVTVP